MTKELEDDCVFPRSWITNWMASQGLVSKEQAYESTQLIGKRAETVIIDDVESPEWRKELTTRFEKQILYGTEKEMEIGGNMCHLCGADMLHYSISHTMVKKHRNMESLQVYTCGTSIFTTWKEYDDSVYANCIRDKERHIHAECIDVTK